MCLLNYNKIKTKNCCFSFFVFTWINCTEAIIMNFVHLNCYQKLLNDSQITKYKQVSFIVVNIGSFFFLWINRYIYVYMYMRVYISMYRKDEDLLVLMDLLWMLWHHNSSSHKFTATYYACDYSAPKKNSNK